MKIQILKEFPGLSIGQILNRPKEYELSHVFFTEDGKRFELPNFEKYPEFFKVLEEQPEWPKTWEDLKVIQGYHINSDSELFMSMDEDSNEMITKPSNQNIFATEKHAISALAFAKLSQLAAKMNDGFEKDWTDSGIKAFTVCCNDEELYTEYYTTIHHNIYFKTLEMAKFSLKHHEQLWREYWMLD